MFAEIIYGTAEYWRICHAEIYCHDSSECLICQESLK